MNLFRVYFNVLVLNVFLQAVASSALGKLVRGLPDTLQRQYEYEEPLVRGGKHLFHSDFFKVSTEVIYPFCSLSCSHCVIFFGRSLFTQWNPQALLFNMGCVMYYFCKRSVPHVHVLRDTVYSQGS